MHEMQFLSDTIVDGVRERDFIIGEIPGVLWGPAERNEATALVLMGHGGGLHKKTPGLTSRALEAVTANGFTVAAIDAPGHGDRPVTAEDTAARAEMQRAMQGGDTAGFRSASLAYTASLTQRAVAEWRTTMDALQTQPEIGHGLPIGYGGGITMGTAIGIPLTAVDHRIRAAIFGGGFFVDDTLIAAARRISVPVQFLLPWDDEHVDRTSALNLFDAFASSEKTLHANPGDHRSVRWVGIDKHFLARHLGSNEAVPS